MITKKKAALIILLIIISYCSGIFVEATTGMYSHFANGKLSKIDAWMNGYTVKVDKTVKAYPNYGYVYNDGSSSEASIFYDGEIYLPLQKMAEFMDICYEINGDTIDIFSKELIDYRYSPETLINDVNNEILLEFDCYMKEKEYVFMTGSLIHNEILNCNAVYLDPGMGPLILVDLNFNGDLDYTYSRYSQYIYKPDIDSYSIGLYDTIFNLYENGLEEIEYVDEERDYLIMIK